MDTITMGIRRWYTGKLYRKDLRRKPKSSRVLVL
jgi:hypothetical protein